MTRRRLPSSPPCTHRSPGRGVQHDPNETTGLDDALRRLLDHFYGPFRVMLVAIGFAAFGVYSLVRAYVNRRQVARR